MDNDDETLRLFFVRGDGVNCRSRPRRRANYSKHEDRDPRWRLFLVHSARVRQGKRRAQNRRWLFWRNRTESNLRTRYLGENALPRIHRNHLRSGENLLRAVARHLLATNRSDAGGWPVHRYRTKLSRCDLLWQR